MRCPNCGTENPEGTTFCSTCGTDLREALPPEPTPSGDALAPASPDAGGAVPQAEAPGMAATPPVRTRPSVLTSGWGAALSWALIAFIVMVVVAMANAFAVKAAVGSAGDIEGIPPGVQPTLSTADTLRLGVMYFHTFHHTSVVLEVGGVEGGGDIAPLPVDGSGSAKASVSLLLGTALAVYLLYRAGRAAAEQGGGVRWVRAIHGLKAALPYAALSLGVSYLATFRPDLPGELGGNAELSVRPSHVGAFLWPLSIGLVAGVLGGTAAARRDPSGAPRWGRQTAGALAGGSRMFVFGLVFAFIGLQIVAFVKDGDEVALPFNPTFLEGIYEPNATVGTVTLAHAIETAPNQAMWVLVPSMAACDTANVNLAIFRIEFDFLCYWDFPGEIRGAEVVPTDTVGGGLFEAPQVPDLGTAPLGYFLFLLVPILAGLLGGRAAARRAAPATRAEGAFAGALAGVVFAALVVVGAMLSGLAVVAEGGAAGISASASARVGPDPLYGGLVALGWGAAFGALGALTATRGLPARAARPEPVASIPPAPPPPA
ncbi:MAG: zinc ribbon domain-containing protein, partial [Actinobacteria bacterium]|nr:zinc ribbon domain-containing protein [Actinomycetota bacterium]